MEWIDTILDGLIDFYQTTNIYQLYKDLDIQIVKLDKRNTLLKGNDAVYHRFLETETVFCRNDLINEEFVLAHELGHAILHVDESIIYFNPLRNNGKMEKEANYFAARLLYSNYQIEDGIETRKQLANRLAINEEFIDYIIK